MCEFFCAHEKGFASGIVPAARLLLELFAALKDTDLTPNLISEGPPYAADRVHVFDLNFCAEFGFLFRPHGNIAITAELPLFHVNVAHCPIDQDLF